MSVVSADLEDHVNLLLDQYQKNSSLCTITPFQANLSVTPEAVPKFFKPRSVPYALRESVENELNRMEQGVLDKTHYSEWATHIVALDVGQYPGADTGLPKGGCFIAKFDHTHKTIVPRPHN